MTKIRVFLIATAFALGLSSLFFQFQTKVPDPTTEKLQRENATLRLLVEIQNKGLARCGFLSFAENKIF